MSSDQGPAVSANRSVGLNAYSLTDSFLLLTAHSFMGWMIVIILLIFYALGVVVFHATSVQILPGIALLVMIADRWLVWKYSK